MLLNILLPPMIIVIGGFFLVKLKSFYLLHPIKTMRYALSGSDTGHSLGSLMLALAGTLGVGNIVGVTVGLAIGGAGSVLWLTLSALFSCAIKYAEVMLSCTSGKGDGMIGVIESDFGRAGKPLSRIYAALCLILSLSMGCLLQASAIKGAAEVWGKIDTGAIVLPLTAVAAFICIKGKGKVRRAVAVMIPIATICYTGMCLLTIIPNFSRLPEVISLILTSALSPRSLAGGLGGFIIKSGMKEGFARGLLSNEAGAGTSSFSHSSTHSDKACRAGCFGIIEVFFDTLFLCPLTAFAVLLSCEGDEYVHDAHILSKIFCEYVGEGADIAFLLCVSAFALSTVLCWYYYGEVCREKLFGSRMRWAYLSLYVGTFTLGLLYGSESSIFFTDTVLLFLSIITLLTLIKKSGGVYPPPKEELYKVKHKRIKKITQAREYEKEA